MLVINGQDIIDGFEKYLFTHQETSITNLIEIVGLGIKRLKFGISSQEIINSFEMSILLSEIVLDIKQVTTTQNLVLMLIHQFHRIGIDSQEIIDDFIEN
jgi:hypothetical protein